METEPTEPGRFVLEGVRGDYSGSMSVFLCAVRFGRLAAMGPPAKTPREVRLQLHRSQISRTSSDGYGRYGRYCTWQSHTGGPCMEHDVCELLEPWPKNGLNPGNGLSVNL